MDNNNEGKAVVLPDGRYFNFGDHNLYSADGNVLYADDKKLKGDAYDVFYYLAENFPYPKSVQDLISAIWEKKTNPVIPNDTRIRGVISELRKFLGDKKRPFKYIITVQKGIYSEGGYKCCSKIEPLPGRSIDNPNFNLDELSNQDCANSRGALEVLNKILCEDEYKSVYTQFELLATRLLSGSDITQVLDNVIDLCGKLHFKANIRFAEEQLELCQIAVSKRKVTSKDILSKIILAQVRLTITLILMEIERLEDEIESCKSKDRNEGLQLRIEQKYRILHMKINESPQYAQELDRLQSEGLPNDSILSLYIKNGSNNK